MFKSRPKAQAILQEFGAKVPPNRPARALGAVFLFDFMDHLLRDGFPGDWLDRLVRASDECLAATRFLSTRLDQDTDLSAQDLPSPDAGLECKTGEVYYELWKDFDKIEYYKNTVAILTERLAKNGLSVDGFHRVLDDGCGSGRYTLALKDLGCAHVTGVDISENSIAFATGMNPFGSDVAFRQASVLELPFPDKSFDLVFSNGVLHHTRDTRKGLDEIYRVLKTGGACWLYLYGGKHSFFWDVVDCCRSLLKDVPQTYTTSLMKVLGYSSGRIFHRNDFFYVPIHNRYLVSEIENLLRSVGFKQWRRLRRGVKYDWDEIIHNHPHIDPYIYGEGELRYLLQK